MTGTQRALVRFGHLKGRQALEDIVTSQSEVFCGGGKVLVNSTFPGRSFTFAVNPSITSASIITDADIALRFIDSSEADYVEQWLKVMPSSRKIVRF